MDYLEHREKIKKMREKQWMLKTQINTIEGDIKVEKIKYIRDFSPYHYLDKVKVIVRNDEEMELFIDTVKLLDDYSFKYTYRSIKDNGKKGWIYPSWHVKQIIGLSDEE